MTTKFINLVVAYSIDEIRAIPHDQQRKVEVLLLWARARYVFDPASTLEDDGDEVLEPSITHRCTCCDGSGRWIKWAPEGGEATVVEVHNEITWGFSGTISTDQNNNIERYRARVPITFQTFDVNVVGPGAGGDTVVVFKKYDKILDTTATVATVTLEAGETQSEPVDVEVELLEDDEIWPEIASVAPAEPPVTMTMNARN